MTNAQALHARQQRLLSSLQAGGYDFYVASSPAAVAYITDLNTRGFPDRDVTVLLAHNGDELLTTSDANEPAIQAASFESPVLYWSHGPNAQDSREDTYRRIAAMLMTRGKARGAVDRSAWGAWVPLLSRVRSEWEFGDADAVLAEASRVKDDDELRRLREAANLADIGYTAVVDRMTPELRVHEIVRNVDRSLRAAGGGDCWSPLEEPSGITGWSHYPRESIATLFGRIPETGVLDTAQLLPFGLFPLSENYAGAIASTIAFRDPGADVRSQAAALADAMQAAIAEIRPGATCGEVHAAFSVALDRHETACSEAVVGYSIGTGLMAPLIAAESAEGIEPGMVLSVRALGDVPGRPGIAYQTSLLVTRQGNELLNIVPLRLIHLY